MVSARSRFARGRRLGKFLVRSNSMGPVAEGVGLSGDAWMVHTCSMVLSGIEERGLIGL